MFNDIKDYTNQLLNEFKEHMRNFTQYMKQEFNK